jgi:uncharacterized protein YjbI with pentapeptide repeats
MQNVLKLWRGIPIKHLQNDEHPRLSLNDTDSREQMRAKAEAHVKASIAWQNKHYQDWLDNLKRRNDENTTRVNGGLKRVIQTIWLTIQTPRHRIKWVFGGGLFGFALLAVVVYAVSISSPVDDAIIKEWFKPNSVTGTFLSLLLASPVAFLIWAYRDQNTTWAIENQRKDINLKDFQKLCEWATGQHLIEGKSVESEKTVVDKEGKSISETTVSTETGKRYEESHSLSKVRAAEALQVAAIYQLQAFLEGEFGKQFMRPAFALLLAVYRGLTESQIASARTTLLLHRRSSEDVAKFQKHRSELLSEIDHPIGVAISNVLVGDGGVRIRLHQLELHAGIFHGISSKLQGIYSLYFANLDMRNFESIASVLSNVNFQQANLENAEFSGNSISNCDFTMSNATSINLMGVEFDTFGDETTFVCAKMNFSNCSSSDMYGVKFNLATLRHAGFQKSDLRTCNFSYSDSLVSG